MKTPIPAGNRAILTALLVMATALWSVNAQNQTPANAPPPAGSTDEDAQMIGVIDINSALHQSQAGKRDFAELESRYPKRAQDKNAQADYESGQKALTSQLGARLQTLLQKYAADNGFNLLIDVSGKPTNILFASPARDITPDAVNLLDGGNARLRRFAGRSAVQPYIYVIDMQSALLGTKDGQKAAAELKAKYAPIAQDLQKTQKELQTKQDLLKQSSITMSEAARAAAQREIDTLASDMKRETDGAQQDLQQDQTRILGELSKKMNGVLSAYATAHSSAMIIDVSGQPNNVIFAATPLDITREIIVLHDSGTNPSGAASLKRGPWFEAVIDMQSALLGTQDGQKAAAELKAKYTPKEQDLQREQRELQAKTDQLGGKAGNTLSDQAKAALQYDIATLQLKRDQQRILGELRNKLTGILDAYAGDHQMALIFDVSGQPNNILFATSQMDITKQMIALYDQAAR
jgi:outer membrane protein